MLKQEFWSNRGTEFQGTFEVSKSYGFAMIFGYVVNL